MVRRIARLADRADPARPRVRRIRRRGVVLERLVVRNVVGLLHAGHRRGGRALAAGRAVRVDGVQREAAGEEAPADVLRVEQVADVLAAEGDLVVGRARTDVADRIGVADQGQAAVAVVGLVAGAVERGDHAVGLARDQVDRARRRRAERGVVRVVAHREVLGVVPHRGDGVAVVVAHHQARRVEDRRRVRRQRTAERVAAGAGVFRIEINEAAVQRLLFRRVVVVLVGRGGLRRAEAERVGRAGAVRRIGRGRVAAEQRPAQAVDGRRVLGRDERRLAAQVQGVRVGAEVMIEGDVLLEDHDEMLDRRRGLEPLGGVFESEGIGLAHRGEGGGDGNGQQLTHEWLRGSTGLKRFLPRTHDPHRHSRGAD